MKVLGGFQFGQMAFDLLPISGRFAATLGDVCMGFQLVVFGNPGNGKTEFCLDLADYFRSLGMGDVAWLSYEQRHGYDLQKGWKRKNLHNNKPGHSSALVIDPIANRKTGVSFIEDLHEYLRKKGSPKFVFIDSIDYAKFKFEEYTTLLKEAFPTKNFIFISHAKGSEPKRAIANEIMYDGGMGIFVKKYIAYVEKNRFGGFEPYVIFEERARDLNPEFFKKRLQDKAQSNTPELELNTPG
jgi:nucleoside-triphosphatase THEP1